MTTSDTLEQYLAAVEISAFRSFIKSVETQQSRSLKNSNLGHAEADLRGRQKETDELFRNDELREIMGNYNPPTSNRAKKN
eukprot:scaffold11571_cov122-Cylindrotheca_fusiformis.AAC.5